MLRLFPFFTGTVWRWAFCKLLSFNVPGVFQAILFRGLFRLCIANLLLLFEPGLSFLIAIEAGIVQLLSEPFMSFTDASVSLLLSYNSLTLNDLLDLSFIGILSALVLSDAFSPLSKHIEWGRGEAVEARSVCELA